MLNNVQKDSGKKLISFVIYHLVVPAVKYFCQGLDMDKLTRHTEIYIPKWYMNNIEIVANCFVSLK